MNFDFFLRLHAVALMNYDINHSFLIKNSPSPMECSIISTCTQSSHLCYIFLLSQRRDTFVMGYDLKGVTFHVIYSCEFSIFFIILDWDSVTIKTIISILVSPLLKSNQPLSNNGDFVCRN